MEKIAEVGTFLFDDYLILGLSKKWLQLLGETPKFEALIDKKRKTNPKIYNIYTKYKVYFV